MKGRDLYVPGLSEDVNASLSKLSCPLLYRVGQLVSTLHAWRWRCHSMRS